MLPLLRPSLQLSLFNSVKIHLMTLSSSLFEYKLLEKSIYFLIKDEGKS